MKKKTPIQVERLEEGLDKCIRQAEILIASSEMLHDNRKFTIALALAILASEENAKAALLQQHLKMKRSISAEDFNRFTGLGSHKTKLTKIHDDIDTTMKRIPKEQFDLSVKLLKSLGFQGEPQVSFEKARDSHRLERPLLLALNHLKKECLYANWNEDGNWSSFLSDASDIEREALSYVELVRAKYWMNWSAWFRHIYKMQRILPFAQVDPNDPNLLQCIEIGRITEQSQYKEMKEIAINVLERYAKKLGYL